MTDPRNTSEEPEVDRLHEEADREKARQQEERHVPREAKDEPPEPFSGADH